MSNKLILNLVEVAQGKPGDMEEVIFVLHSNRVLHGSFAGDIFRSQGHYFRLDEVQSWCSMPRWIVDID
jgi:hypothetical protein